MSERWQRLRETCDRLEPGTVLVTPVSERPFAVESTDADRIDVRFRDSGEELSLRRDQFDVLADRLEDGPLPLETLPPGVEPYAVVLSLAPSYESDGETLAHAPADGTAGESPHVQSPEEARTAPERVHDDAALLVDLLERLDADDPSALETESLTDLYVLLSDVQRGAGRLRRTVGDPLLDRLGPGQQLHGRFGTVRRTTRERRRPKDDDVVLDALDDRGIPHEWVLGVDPEKLDVVLATTDLRESAVYGVDEQVYVQKTGVEEGEKVSRLEGLASRVAEGPVDEQLHDDLVDLEERLDEALSAG